MGEVNMGWLWSITLASSRASFLGKLFKTWAKDPEQ